mmetsp:Transcript_24264/g.69784  ORF Transcript_24264/g.69784 Transcript_24264/m.69784 type:complete len:97 (-) Transcript_24264:90-380(-)
MCGWADVERFQWTVPSASTVRYEATSIRVMVSTTAMSSANRVPFADGPPQSKMLVRQYTALVHATPIRRWDRSHDLWKAAAALACCFWAKYSVPSW